MKTCVRCVNALFVLTTTSSNFSPPARWPSSLNQSTPLAPYCFLQVGDNPPSQSVPNYLRVFLWCPAERIAVRCFFSLLFSWSSQIFGLKGKRAKGGRLAQDTPGWRVKMSLQWQKYRLCHPARLQFGWYQKLCAKVAGEAGHSAFHPRIRRGAQWHQQTPPTAVTITAESRAREKIRFSRKKPSN